MTYANKSRTTCACASDGTIDGASRVRKNRPHSKFLLLAYVLPVLTCSRRGESRFVCHVIMLQGSALRIRPSTRGNIAFVRNSY